MNKKWDSYKIDESLIAPLAEKHNISDLLARILINRGITEDDKIEKFLYPKLEDLNNPFDFNDMDKAIDRIIKAVESKEPITIYGDYDVDGITSTTILYKFLSELDAIVDYYLPNRIQEGYGLNNEAVALIKERGTKLLITVDCGISGLEEVELANSLGLKVIVTDHHNAPETVPDAVVILDPKAPDSGYPFADISGAAVAYKLVSALRFSQSDFYNSEICIIDVEDNQINCVKIKNLVK